MNVPQLRFKGFEGEWKETTIEQEVAFFDHKRRPVTENLRNKGIYPYYGATGVIDYVDSYVLEGDFLLLAEDGANIITRSAPVVYKTEGKFWVNNHAHVLKPIQSNDFNFFYELLESINYIKYNSGTAQPKLNLQNVKKVPIHIPESSEQIKIGKFFELISKRLVKQKEKVEKLEQFKKGMMQKIFSQELRFKDEDGGEFPEWEKVKLRDVSTVSSGKRLPKGHSFSNKGIPYISVSNMGERYVNKANSLFIDENTEKILKKYKVNSGDIIISIAGTLGKINIIDDALNNANLTENCNKISNFKNVINTYVFYIFKSEAIQRKIKEFSTTSSQPKLALDRLRDFWFFVPSLKEQQKISQFLLTIDNKIGKEKEKLIMLEEQKSGYTEKMFI